MKNVVKDVVEAQQRSDEMFLKMEEKRMQLSLKTRVMRKKTSLPERS